MIIIMPETKVILTRKNLIVMPETRSKIKNKDQIMICYLFDKLTLKSKNQIIMSKTHHFSTTLPPDLYPGTQSL